MVDWISTAVTSLILFSQGSISNDSIEMLMNNGVAGKQQCVEQVSIVIVVIKICRKPSPSLIDCFLLQIEDKKEAEEKQEVVDETCPESESAM